MYKGLIKLDRTTFLFIVLHFFSNVYSFLIIFYQISSFFKYFFKISPLPPYLKAKEKRSLLAKGEKQKVLFIKKGILSNVSSALDSSAKSDNIRIFKIGSRRNTVCKSCDLYAERL